FGGVAEVLVPDNLKTGVTKPLRGDPIINEAYRELADYYRAVVVPAQSTSKISPGFLLIGMVSLCFFAKFPYFSANVR
ncbi:hypothetical protein KQ939_17640, partial [Planococcus sp. CP5-4]|nr:hypothetical protein [Planococcus sp. CP5-4]